MIETDCKKLETERQIAESVAEGDAKAIRELYDRTVGYMTSVATRYLGSSDDVSDVLQESYIYIISSISKFEYRGEGSLKAWMSRIVANKSVDHLKAAAKHEKMFVAQDPPDLPYDDCDADFDDVPIDAIHCMIQSLPVGYRTVFNLYVFEGCSHSEIAKRLGIKERTSSSQLLRAKRLLAQQITEYKQLINHL